MDFYIDKLINLSLVSWCNNSIYTYTFCAKYRKNYSSFQTNDVYSPGTINGKQVGWGNYSQHQNLWDVVTTGTLTGVFKLKLR